MSSTNAPVINRDDHAQTLINCGGLYDAPPTGPLVGYAGTYENGQHYVGFRYFNVAMAEQWPHVMDYFAACLSDELDNLGHRPDVILGAPMGGIVFGQNLARQLNCRFVFAEKIQVTAGEGGQRGKEELVLARHDIHPGERVGVAEDIANNFTTTLELLKLILAAGGIPIFLACVVNRSDRTLYATDGIGPLPVVSLIHLPTSQYRQDDPVVAELVQAGKVVWKPKHRWPDLKAAMDAAHQAERC